MAPYDDGPIDPFYPHGRPGGGSSDASPGRPARAPAVERKAPAPARAPMPERRPEARRLPTPRPGQRTSSAGGRLIRGFLPLILAVGAGAAYVVYTQVFEKQTLIVLNGLDVTVDVLLLGEGDDEWQREIPPRGRASFELSGLVLLDAVTFDGQLVENTSFEVPDDTDLVAYNLLGAAAVQLEEIVYTDNPAMGFAPTVVPMWGERLIVRDDVTYIFVEPPSQAAIPSNQSEVRHWHFGYVGDGSWRTTLDQLLGSPGAVLSAETRARATAIVHAVRTIDPSNPALPGYEARLQETGRAPDTGGGRFAPSGTPSRQRAPGDREVVGPGGVGRLPPSGRTK